MSENRHYLQIRNPHAIATKHHSSGAGILTSMAGADGLVEIDEDVTRLAAGTEVTFIPFSGILTG